MGIAEEAKKVPVMGPFLLIMVLASLVRYHDQNEVSEKGKKGNDDRNTNRYVYYEFVLKKL